MGEDSMNISFSATTDQVRQHRKHVTRRVDKSLRLSKLKPGTILLGIEKGQGIKKGEHVVKLDRIEILEVNRELVSEIVRSPFRVLPKEIINQYLLSPYLLSEMTLEGFPNQTSFEFVKTFCRINPKCTPDTEITRVLFDYVEVPR